MATVPTNEQTVFPEQGPLPQANGADFGAQIGAAQQGVGAELNQVGDEAFQQAIKWQGLKNEATAQDLDVQFQGDLGKLEDGYYSLKGKAAADAYPGFQSDVTALRQRYLGASPNPMVQQMLGQSVGYSVARSLRSAGQMAGEQTRAWMVDSGTSRIESLNYNATKRFNDQGLADETDKARDAAIDSLGQIQGWSADHIALAKQQSRDKLLADRQAAAQTYLKGQPVADVLHSLVGDSAASAGGPVGGAAYRTAVVATEFESGQNNPNNPHQGPVQADDDWWKRFGRGGDRNNMQDALKALDLETSVNKPQLETQLKRPVTDADLYLAHQQGLAGALAILTNPDLPAASSVGHAAVANNLPANSGMDADTITGAQFSNIWAKGFDQSGGIMANNPASKNNQLDSAIAVLSDAQKMELTKGTLDAWRTQDAAVREQTNFQQQQQAKAEKQEYDGIVNAAKGVMEKNYGNPNNPPLDIGKLSQNPWFVAHPQALTDVLDYQKALNRPDGDTNASAHNTSAMFGKMFPANGSSPLSQSDIDAAFVSQDPGTHINKADHDWLTSQLADAKDPTMKRLNGQANDVFKVVERQIDPSFTGAMGSADHSPFAGQRMLQYKQAVAEKIAAFKAAGKDPSILFDPTPSNKDYVGSAGFTAPFTRSLTDLMTEEATGQEAQPAATAAAQAPAPTAPAPTQPSVSIPPELPKGTTYAGKTKDGRDAYRMPDGTLRALAAPTAPLAAAGAPDVPTGE